VLHLREPWLELHHLGPFFGDHRHNPGRQPVHQSIPCSCRQMRKEMKIMLWRTHFLAGSAAGLLMVGNTTDIKTAAISAVVAGVAALLPDLDDPHSKLGRIVPIISWAVKTAVGHRGPLHSLSGVDIVYVLAALFIHPGNTNLTPFPLMVAAGYFSHIVIDSLNPPGCPWLWPLDIHFKLPLTETGGILESMRLFWQFP